MHKTLIFFGIILIIAGVLINIFGKIPGLGKLPGDIHIKGKSFTFFFPITTCILVSIIISLIFFIWRKVQ